MKKIDKLISKIHTQEQIVEMRITDCVQMRGLIVFKVFCKLEQGKNTRWIVEQFPTKGEAIVRVKQLAHLYPVRDGTLFEDVSVIPKDMWDRFKPCDDNDDLNIELFLQMKEMAVKAWQDENS